MNTFSQPTDTAQLPPYLPHRANPEVLQMGLTPLLGNLWIETDSSVPHFHRHKHRQRALHGDNVYRCTQASLAAQQELRTLLLQHLTQEQADFYSLHDDHLVYKPTGLQFPVSADEVLWNASLWIADDLVILLPDNGNFTLNAASLCSPSHWRLQDKFGLPLWQVHNNIPDFHQQLTPRINRFLSHLKPEHPVIRYNWSLQADDELNPEIHSNSPVNAATILYYRTERQSLRRLPETGAIVFTIRVYLHPLSTLHAIPGAMPALFQAISDAPPAIAQYKGFQRLAPAFAKYRSGTS